MSDTHKISEFIDSISFRKTLGGGFRPDDVYDSICQLTSLYNEVLASSYKENEELRKQLDERAAPAASYVPAQTYADAEKVEEKPEKDTSEERPEIDFRSLFGEELEDYRAIRARFCFDSDTTSSSKTETDSVEHKKTELYSSKNEAAHKPQAKESCEEQGSVNEKELQRMRRSELLEVMLEQSREEERLRCRISELESEIRSLSDKLSDRTIKLEKAGSMAEASLLINGVVEAAQAAADQYLENLKSYSEREAINCRQKEAESAEYVDRMLADAKKQCDSMIKSAEDRCAVITYISQQQCESMKAEALTYCSQLEASTKQKCEELEEFTKQKCESREKQAEERCRELDLKAQQETAKCWDDVTKRMDDFYKMQEYLREILNGTEKVPRA